MASGNIKEPDDVVQRNLALADQITRFLLSQPALIESLPADFELIILPEDDPEMRLYNLELLDKYSHAGKEVVFARVNPRAVHKEPAIYAPVPGD